MRRQTHNVSLACLILAFTQVSCGIASLAECEDDDDPTPLCSPKSDDEVAMLALEEQDYGTAIRILTELIALEPGEYFRYPRIAAAYASLAGFSALDIIKDQILKSGKASSGGTQTALSAIVPEFTVEDEDYYNVRIELLKSARDWLEVMPPDHRVPTVPYGTSAAFQSTIYHTLVALMTLNKFVVPTTVSSTDLDPSRLEALSDEETEEILNNLQQAGGIDATDTQIQEKINATLAEIDAQPGSTRREKLIAYVQSTRGASGQTSSETSTETPSETIDTSSEAGETSEESGETSPDGESETPSP